MASATAAGATVAATAEATVEAAAVASEALRVLVLGASGSIGRATVQALAERGHAVVAVLRPGRPVETTSGRAVEVRTAEASDADSLARDALRGEHFDAVVSCLASRSGAPADAWAVDHRANLNALRSAQAAAIPRFVLLSAICVQKPRLAFQHAKLAFERELMGSGLAWSIVRPTAFFKSLSGQVERVRQGKPFLVFGDGRLTACKPISDRDCASFIVDTLVDPACHGRILPIGGPGPALTPLDQAEALHRLIGRPPRVKHVPLALMRGIAGALGAAAAVLPALAAKAEFARIGHYYASESMLVWDAERGRYNAAATPEHGRDTLLAHYEALLAGRVNHERGDHAVF
jgi:divinyl chlorophyllide a 8-vinyl-reductase